MAQLGQPKILCRTRNKPGTTHIPARKFDTIHRAILKVLTSCPMRWGDLTGKMRADFVAQQLTGIGAGACRLGARCDP